jgi:hypothetical protein
MRNIPSRGSDYYQQRRVGPTMADGGALFNITSVTTEGGHANLDTSALSANAWDAACRSSIGSRC